MLYFLVPVMNYRLVPTLDGEGVLLCAVACVMYVD